MRDASAGAIIRAAPAPGDVAARVPSHRTGTTMSAPDAPKYCDLVMKGGITSGVVYPLAICELARSFSFRNIGGTSAGAIAASAAAAAEYGRGVPGAGFEELARLPAWLGAGRNLLDLFQPQPATKALFRVALAGVGHGSHVRRAIRVAGTALARFPLSAIAGAIPGAWVAWLALAMVAGGAARWVTLAVAIVALVLGATIGVVVAMLVDAARALPANHYGLCRGYDAGEWRGRPGLTRWLDGELDLLAGRANSQWPLTFRHLWLGRERGAAMDAAIAASADVAHLALPMPDERRVNLEMVTTSLTHGRPYRLPFEQRTFMFDPAELRLYFPERVVRWMELRSARVPDVATGQVLYAMPKAADLPVIVAARMSLSFPLLFSAVPLYARDYGRPEDVRRPERVWFSDGGISSNFPVHFFDALLPRWPTFAINLRPFTPDYPRDETHEANNVYVVRTNGDGRSEWWNRFEVDPSTERQLGGLRRVANFLLSMLSAGLDWRDNLDARMPGYRDRIAHVKLDEAQEGGLNLTMPADVIARLSERGRLAGERLRTRFTTGEPGTVISWPNHRWVRYRSAMQMLQRSLDGMVKACRAPEPPPIDYLWLVDRPPGAAPRGYAWSPTQRDADPRAATETLLKAAESWRRSAMDFGDGAPKPKPELRATPRF